MSIVTQAARFVFLLCVYQEQQELSILIYLVHCFGFAITKCVIKRYAPVMNRGQRYSFNSLSLYCMVCAICPVWLYRVTLPLSGLSLYIPTSRPPVDGDQHTHPDLHVEFWSPVDNDQFTFWGVLIAPCPQVEVGAQNLLYSFLLGAIVSINKVVLFISLDRFLML